MTYAMAIRRRADLIETRKIMHAAHKGTPFLDRELVKITTWLVEYANRQDRKQKAA